MSEQVRIAIAVVKSSDRFLIGRRPAGKVLAGLWEFPGGKIEQGESDLEAAVRECKEETGLQVTAIGHYLQKEHQYEHANLHLSFVACRLVKPDGLQTRFSWVPRKELENLEFPVANQQLLDMLRDEISPDLL